MRSFWILSVAGLVISALAVGVQPAIAQKPGQEKGTKQTAAKGGTKVAAKAGQKKQGAALTAKGRKQALTAKRQGKKDRLAWWAKELNLTQDQIAKIRSILESERQQLAGLKPRKAASAAERAELKAKVRAIRQRTMQLIRSVLTPEQQRKWDEMHKRPRNTGKRPVIKP